MANPRSLMKSNDFEVTVRMHTSSLLSNLTGLVMVALGAITLAWVGQLTWHDITVWSKDLSLIFFSSRTAEHMFPTLGIDMRVIHYFLIGSAFSFSGLIIFLRSRTRAGKLHPNPSEDTQPVKIEEDLPGCSHNFGYFGSLPDSTTIPVECLICQKMLECRNALS